MPLEDHLLRVGLGRLHAHLVGDVGEQLALDHGLQDLLLEAHQLHELRVHLRARHHHLGDGHVLVLVVAVLDGVSVDLDQGLVAQADRVARQAEREAKREGEDAEDNPDDEALGGVAERLDHEWLEGSAPLPAW